MKKINFLLMATMVVFAGVFMSCSEDDVPSTVTISLDAVSFNAGTAVTGSITTTDKLESVTLLKDGVAVTGWPISSFSAGAAVVGADGAYTIRIEGLEAGSYSLRATDKSGVEHNVSFTVGAASSDGGTLNAEIANVIITTTVADGGTTSACSAIDGSLYTAAATAAQQELIHFVYFDGNGTTGVPKRIYAPSTAAAIALTPVATLYQAWNTKNVTLFKKVTASDYTNATYASVVALTSDAIDTYTGALSVGDVYVFKESLRTVGIFKVEALNGVGVYNNTDNVVISIKSASYVM